MSEPEETIEIKGRSVRLFRSSPDDGPSGAGRQQGDLFQEPSRREGADLQQEITKADLPIDRGATVRA